MNWLGLNAKELIAAVRVTSRLTFAPHDGPKVGWKLNAAGDAVELKDGNPIWVNADGTETTLGGDTITRLNGEAARNRKDKEALEAKLQAFEGIDPEKARAALDTVKNIDQNKLVDAGKLEEVRQQIGAEWQGKLDDANKATEAANARADGYLLNNAFEASKFIADKLTIPPDMVQATFGNRFKVEDGKIVAYDAHGNKLNSRTRGGELANLDEALDFFVEGYSHRDKIMKGGNHQGGGSGGGDGGGNGKRTYRRSEIDELNGAGKHMEVAKIMEAVNKGEAVLND